MSTRRTRSLSSLPEIVQKTAREAGVDPAKEVCIEYTYGEHAALAGYGTESDKPMYAGDPRGSFPGRYLLVNLGWGRERELWQNSQVSDLCCSRSITGLFLLSFLLFYLFL